MIMLQALKRTFFFFFFFFFFCVPSYIFGVHHSWWDFSS